jgi:peptidoglycan/LPS O-acetylase OafA/YrhL
MRNADRRLLEIDLLRFLAALSVVLYHWAFRGHAADGLSSMHYPAIAGWAKYGFLGVELFFVISGFVILMSARSGSLRDFAVSRVVRLYPAFWFCCTLSALVMLWLAPGRPGYEVGFAQYLVNMTMFSGFVGVASIDGVYWSLFVEMRFYLMVALVLALGWMPRVERLLWVWLAIVFVQQFVRTGPLWMIFNTAYAALFIAGAVLYLVHERGWTAARALLLNLCLLLAIWQQLKGLPALEKHYRTDFSPFAVAGCIVLIFAVMAAAASGGLRWLRHPWCLPLGATTYPLYLVHQNIGYLVFDSLLARTDRHLLFWGAVLAVIALAYAIHRGIEKPLAAWMRRRLLLRRPAPA